MNVHTKSPKQVEFADLFDRLRPFGFNQSRLAKLCRYSAAAVSMVLKGEREPDEAKLELMRREVKILTEPGYREPSSQEQDEPHRQLSMLKEKSPAGYKAATVMLGAIYRDMVGGVSSKVASVAQGSQASASALARSELQGQQPTHPVGEPAAINAGEGAALVGREDSGLEL